MDIRCGSCSKLFRVADEKIAGKGIRFKCTKCGDVITVTAQDLEMDLLAREGGDEVPVIKQAPTPQPTPPPPAAAAPPPPPPATEPEAREYKPPPPDPGDSETQEDAGPSVPSAGLEDFDFSAPDVAAQHAQEQDAGLGDFSFGDQGGLDEQGTSAEETDEPTGEVAISEEEAQAADDAFAFPTDMISEPKRKPAFGAPTEETPAGGSEEDTSAEGAAEETLDVPAMETPAPELAPEPEPAPTPVQAKATAAPELPKTGPVFTPPPRTSASAAKPASDDEIDLGAALAIPRTAGEPDAASGGAEEGMEEPVSTETGSFPVPSAQDGELHPLASGNLTGALTGVGCAIPIVVLLSFGLSMVAKFVPFLGQLPFLHLIAVTGAGIISFGVMLGILIAMLQAKAGKKLFFLINILVGTFFGAGFGAGMLAVVGLASGSGLNIGQVLSGAINGAVTAGLISIVLVIVRRIMMFTKDETFSAAMTGGQKAGLALSLVIILAAGYGQGTLTGKLEHAAQKMTEQFQAEITPDGLSVVGAAAYIDDASGDLVITGSVRNALSQPKPGWYLEVQVLDAAQRAVAKVEMVNGVQLLTRREFSLLEQRGKDIKTLKTQMVLAIQTGEIPASGSVPFELHLMQPPAEVASFLPVLKKFDPAATFAGMAAAMGDQ